MKKISRGCGVGAVLAAALLLSPVIRAGSEVDETAQAIKRAHRNGAELVQAGQYDRAVQYLRTAVGKYAGAAALHRLLAAAALDRAIELDDRLTNALSRLYLVSLIRKTVDSSSEPAFKDATGTVTREAADAAQSFQRIQATRREVQALLKEAGKEAVTALSGEELSSREALMAVWIDAYRIVQADGARALQARLQPLQTGREVAPALIEPAAPDQLFDRQATRRHALRLLSQMARARPDDPLPYLAAAEWLQLVESRGGRASALDAERNWRYREGIAAPGQPVAGTAAADEYHAAQRTALGDLADIGLAQLQALYERAAKLDARDEYGSAYALYVQTLPGDPSRGQALMDQVARKELGNAAGALEKARTAAATGDREAALRHLNAAAAMPRFHRRLLTTLPGEIRRSFLSSHLLWKNLTEVGFGFDFISRLMQDCYHLTQAPDDRRRLSLLQTRLGELLMQSDLPHDWVLGAKLRRDALGQLARDKELRPDLAARFTADRAKIEAELNSRSLPLLFGILYQNQVHIIPVTDADGMITGPCIIVNMSGGQMIGS